MSLSTGHRRVERVRYELKRREVEVSKIERLAEHLVRITFRGEALEDFVSGSFDDHVKFMFADSDGETIRRDYTPRHFDRERREITIEFALHGHGKASQWAARADVGQRAAIGGPRGSTIIPADVDWHLLAGDETALPAIRRRLEELPASAEVTVIVLAAPGERCDLQSRAAARIRRVATADELVAAVYAWEVPGGEGFAWCAGEASTMAALREVLAHEKRLPKEAMRVAAYWKRGASEYHQNLE